MKKRINRILAGVCLTLGYSLYTLCYWASQVFGVGIDEIVFTMTSPLNGFDKTVLKSALLTCIPRIAIVLIAYTVLVFTDSRINFTVTLSAKIKKFVFKLDLVNFFRRAVALICILSIPLSLMYILKQYDIIGYINNQTVTSTIYEDYYIDPKNANITLATEDGEYKNLIYVYLESMEVTYTTADNGGKQDTCYIPKLSELAKNNISFSNTNKLGGFNNTYGTGYTMGALMALTSGVPFAFPVGGNNMQYRKDFAPGLTTLGDILEGFGYNQAFLCGSDGEFAGRAKYFEQHGSYEMIDLFAAREKGYIPEDYYEFWGFEDLKLYEIAKSEILKLAEQDKPFNFSMLTVDTHHISGYICSACTNEYDMQIKNVLKCTDCQIAEFIEWCKQQSFYEDTVIILTGDHPRMDTDLVKDADYKERAIYNCFINCGTDTELNTENRTFTPMDIFPTTLSVMGFKWDGNRLALGTNLFSDEKTLAEELGFDYFNGELAKKSMYYLNNFQ